MCVCTHTHTPTHTPQCTCGGQRKACRSQFSLSTVWLPEIKPRYANLPVSPFTWGAISLHLLGSRNASYSSKHFTVISLALCSSLSKVITELLLRTEEAIAPYASNKKGTHVKIEYFFFFFYKLFSWRVPAGKGWITHLLNIPHQQVKGVGWAQSLKGKQAASISMVGPLTLEQNSAPVNCGVHSIPLTHWCYKATGCGHHI